MNITPLSDWILVKFDPLRKRSTDIFLPGEEDKVAVRTGTVIRVGPGKPTRSGKRVPMHVSPGDRIAFFRWHQEHRPGKAVSKALSEIGDDVFMIRQSDVLFVFDGDVIVDV